MCQYLSSRLVKGTRFLSSSSGDRCKDRSFYVPFSRLENNQDSWYTTTPYNVGFTLRQQPGNDKAIITRKQQLMLIGRYATFARVALLLYSNNSPRVLKHVTYMQHLKPQAWTYSEHPYSSYSAHHKQLIEKCLALLQEILNGSRNFPLYTIINSSTHTRR